MRGWMSDSQMARRSSGGRRGKGWNVVVDGEGMVMSLMRA